MGAFSRDAAITTGSQALSLVLGIGASIIIARALGPEGKGIYSLALLIPSLIVTLSHLGVNLATVYYGARREFAYPDILGSNIWLAIGTGSAGVMAGIIVVLFLRDMVVPGVPRGYLFLGLAVIPAELLFSYVQYVLLGAQRLLAFNGIAVAHKVVSLLFVMAAVWLAGRGVSGALAAALASWVVTDLILCVIARRIAGGLRFNVNWSYVRKAVKFGVQAHLGNIFWFLTHRVDLFLVNGYLGPMAVGFYSLGVAVVEHLWIVSQAASTVLLPRVAAETDEDRRKRFTPLVARSALLLTSLGAIVVAAVAHWVVGLLYSQAFLPAVEPLRILLLGIVALSGARVLANDFAGRGRPMLNTYVVCAGLLLNLGMNVLLIPRYGISGAAWASSISYTLILVARVVLYCRLTGNPWTTVIFPQRGDWALYWKAALMLLQGLAASLRGVCKRKT